MKIEILASERRNQIYPHEMYILRSAAVGETRTGKTARRHYYLLTIHSCPLNHPEVLLFGVHVDCFCNQEAFAV